MPATGLTGRGEWVEEGTGSRKRLLKEKGGGDR